MSRSGIVWLSFTEKGRALALTLSKALGGEVSCTRDGAALAAWTAENFPSARALVYVGAAGIAVRAVAPHLVSKACDPAVLAVDECGYFAVPLASGHLGGANALAREIARVSGATAVITTATDINHVFAFDEWARTQGMAVTDAGRIKVVSAKLLRGEPVTLRSAFPIDGTPPEGVALTDTGGADVWVDVRPHDALTLVPRALVLGVGCRRGTSAESLEAGFAAFCTENRVLPESVSAAATIGLKRDEAGLSAFCRSHGWALAYYSAEELAAAGGGFSASAFVEQTVGVDNVCERAAVLSAQGGLFVRKTAGGGMTFALAAAETHLDWRLSDG